MRYSVRKKFRLFVDIVKKHLVFVASVHIFSQYADVEFFGSPSQAREVRHVVSDSLTIRPIYREIFRDLKLDDIEDIYYDCEDKRILSAGSRCEYLLEQLIGPYPY